MGQRNADRFRIYIENGRTHPPEYRVTAEQVAAAARQHPDLDERLDVTIAYDDEPDAARLVAAEILLAGKFDTKTLPARAPSLRWVHSRSAGVEHLLPLDWLPPNAVLTNSSGAHGLKAGEFGLMALMMLNDHMPEHMTNQRRRRWVPVYSTPIEGKTVVILGVGGLGGAVAERARLLGLRVIGVSRSGEPHPACDRVVPSTEFLSVLPDADFLVVSCPLTAETKRMVDSVALDRMKPGAGLVNIARAAVVDYEALAAKLEAGELSGAVLDVFDPEPLPETAKWWDVPRLVVVPHVSSDHAGQYILRVLDIFFGNLRRYAAGEPLKNVVDRELGY